MITSEIALTDQPKALTKYDLMFFIFLVSVQKKKNFFSGMHAFYHKCLYLYVFFSLLPYLKLLGNFFTKKYKNCQFRNRVKTCISGAFLREIYRKII